jgi:hypothetical protein
MPRASSVFCLPALLAAASLANAAELPVIVNGTQVAQAPAPTSDAPPPAKGQLPVIINYAAAFQATPSEAPKSDAKLPTIVNESPKPTKAAPVRAVYAYSFPAGGEYMAPVAYNAYSVGGPMLGAYGSLGYMPTGYATGIGYYGGAGYGGLGYGYAAGYGYSAYSPAVALTSSLVDLRPPRVEVLDTGVRPNVGRLTSMPSVASPVYGEVIGLYYR